MSGLQELQKILLERRVAYACFLLGLVVDQVPELPRDSRQQLAGRIGQVLKAIEAADQAGAP